MNAPGDHYPRYADIELCPRVSPTILTMSRITIRFSLAETGGQCDSQLQEEDRLMFKAVLNCGTPADPCPIMNSIMRTACTECKYYYRERVSPLQDAHGNGLRDETRQYRPPSFRRNFSPQSARSPDIICGEAWTKVLT